MEILKIRKYGDPILRQKCEPVKVVGEAERSLLEDMLRTMYSAEGIGLAAPQVGVNKRLIVVDAREGKGPIKLVNPKIIFREGKDFLEEGCLSLRDITVNVKRAKKVKVEGLNENGQKITLEADGLMARAIQHEVDHLSGILITDRASFIEKLRLRSKLYRLKKVSMAIRF